MFFSYLAFFAAGGFLLLPGASAELHKLAKAAGKLYFGSAVDNGDITNELYAALLSKDDLIGQITPGNTQKWQYTEPSENSFDYTKGDVIISFAQKNSRVVRCHTLVWYNQLPGWVSTGTWTNETLSALLKAHIASEVQHYKGECYSWDVVNEALSDSGGYRSSVFYKVMGESYISVAFEAAAAADDKVKLYYNDYNIEKAGTKLDEAIAIVKLVQKAGARIDGVGLQGHFIVGTTPSQSALEAVLNKFVSLGVEVAFTEIDVRFSSLPPTSDGLQQQAIDYTNVVKACLAVDKCVGITVWGLVDSFSWIPSTFSGAGDACLYGSNMVAKPAYYSIKEALASASKKNSTKSCSSVHRAKASSRPKSSAVAGSR